VNDGIGETQVSGSRLRQFDEQFGSAAQQTDLVLFLDGQERAGRAIEASMEEFRHSWRRPKWHLLSKSLAGRMTGRAQFLEP
jgi:hypothetical protein